MSGPLILFDMDGVVFREDGYLQCAALTIAQVYQLTHHEMTNWRYDPNRVAHQEDVIALQAVYLHETVIRLLRQRAINNNWDKTFASLCILLGYPTILPEEAIAETLVSVFSQIEGEGDAFLRGCYRYYSRDNEKRTAFYQDVKKRFQRYYLGDKLAHTPLLVDGLLTLETTILPTVMIDDLFASLCEAGATLGVGTGRPLEEVIRPLQQLRLLSYFDAKRIKTHDDVVAYAEQLGVMEQVVAKPHPYVYLAGADGFLPSQTFVVGDSMADARAAFQAGFHFYGIGTAASFGELAKDSAAIAEDVVQLKGKLLDDVRRIAML